MVDHWHNTGLMHLGRDKLQKDLESKFLFPPGHYAVLNWYCKACAVCRATKHANSSIAGNLLHTAIPESPMRLVSMDVFATPEVTVEGEVFDCFFLAVNRHSRYIVSVLGEKSKNKRQEGQARSGAASLDRGASNDRALVDSV